MIRALNRRGNISGLGSFWSQAFTWACRTRSSPETVLESTRHEEMSRCVWLFDESGSSFIYAVLAFTSRFVVYYADLQHVSTR